MLSCLPSLEELEDAAFLRITLLAEAEAGVGVVVEVLGTRILLGMVHLIKIFELETTRITRQIKLWYFSGYWNVSIILRLTTRFLVGEQMRGYLWCRVLTFL